MSENLKDYDVRLTRARIQFECFIIQVQAKSEDAAGRIAIREAEGVKSMEWDPIAGEPILGPAFIRSPADVLDMSGEQGDFEILEKKLAWAEGLIRNLKQWSESAHTAKASAPIRAMIAAAEVAKP
jgi:hypothetical protein